MKNYLSLSKNSWAIALVTAGIIVLGLIGVMYKVPVIGLPSVLLMIFILPGLVILHRRIATSSLLETLFLSTILSTALSGILLSTATAIGMPVTGKWILLVLALLLIALTIIFKPFTSTQILLEKLVIKSHHKPLMAALLLFIGAHLLSMLLYPYIPEADGYGVVLRIREIIETGSISNVGYRPLFPLLTASISAISHIDAAILVKYLIPLLLAVTTIPLYLIARSHSENKLWQFTVSTLPLTVPVIFQEIELVRTQSFIIFTAFAVLYLLRYRKSNTHSVLALLLSAVSIYAHELGFILLAISLVVVASGHMHYIRKHWPVMALLLGCLLLNVIFVLSNTFVGSEVIRYAKIIYTNVLNGSFDPWFIDSYRNVDGSQVGWPGWLSLLFYGYNLGLAIPFLLIIWILRRVKATERFAAPILLAAFALFIAELLPRIGVAFLPDRAWLYLSIALVFILAELRWDKLTHKLALTIATVAMASIAISVLVTPVRGGWVNDTDYQAAVWIRENTSKSALILSQGGNGPTVLVYADRKFMNATPLFALGDKLSREDISSFIRLSGGPYVLPHDEVGKYITTLQDEEVALWTRMQELLQLEHADTSTIEISSKEHTDAVREWRDKHSELARITAAYESTRPTGESYLMFSTNKISGLYGTREWWKEINAASFNVETLIKLGLEIVYDTNGVYIFKVK